MTDKMSRKTPRNTIKPIKATDRMSPQFAAYAEGRKPNVGGDANKRPNADHKQNRAAKEDLEE